MLVTYHRAGRLSLFPALAAVAAAVMLAGIAAVALVIVGGTACALWLVRSVGRIGRPDRRVLAHDHDTIEGVVVDSTDVSDQLLRLDSDKG
jgi:hypothetical protein